MKLPFCHQDFPSLVTVPFVALVIGLFAGGCASTRTGQSEEPPDGGNGAGQGYVFYLDGAGGATARDNWSESVKEGLSDGGYQGTGEVFAWEKGSGLKANEDTTLAYKRKRADELSWAIEERLEEFPEAPVEIIGFSAGGAVVLHALEALPESVQVKNVVLLGTSVAGDYDLTEALKRVKGSLTVFVSSEDRNAAADGAEPGVPEDAGAETRLLYAEKVMVIPVDGSLGKDGSPEHIDREFMRDQVAPLLVDWSGFDSYGDGGSLFAD